MHIKTKHDQMEIIEGITSEYPYVMHKVDLSKTRIPWHWHEELEFCYVKAGTVRLLTIDGDFSFHHGEAFFINSNALSTVESGISDENAIIDSHLFHPVFLSGHFQSVFETKYLNPVLRNKNLKHLSIYGNNQTQKEILYKLRKAAILQDKSNSEFQIRNLFSEIWLLLLNEISLSEQKNVPATLVKQERIQTMMSFIQSNYGEKVSLDDIAASASVGKREALRSFQNYIHQTPIEYLTECRIEAAKKLLKTSNLSILEIALQSGFSNESYFCKIFKKHTDTTPNAYRKIHLL